MIKASQTEITKNAAEKLKEYIKMPEWARFVKTGHSKEKPPTSKDWYYIRAASVLRRINQLGPIGVSKLRTKYSSRKNKGVRPEHSYKASGKIIRTILQQFERQGLIKQEQKGAHKGRVITKKGLNVLFEGLSVKKEQ
jgi:small subunit ribosomal protein S19e